MLASVEAEESKITLTGEQKQTTSVELAWSTDVVHEKDPRRSTMRMSDVSQGQMKTGGY